VILLFYHGSENCVFAYLAGIKDRPWYFLNGLYSSATPVQRYDVVFPRWIICSIEDALRAENQRGSTISLLTLNQRLQVAEPIGGLPDPHLWIPVPGADQNGIFIRIIDNPVHMAYGTFRKGVYNLPFLPSIC
jgi:hypothetical protein